MRELFRIGAKPVGARSRSERFVKWFRGGGGHLTRLWSPGYRHRRFDSSAAAYCGVVGIKATYGLVPIRGIVPLAVSLDHCGPITRTVEDAALMLNTLAGYDRYDITSVQHPKEDYVAALDQPVSGFRLGIPRAPFYDHCDEDTAKAVEAAILVLGKMTKSVKDVSLPSTAAIPGHPE